VCVLRLMTDRVQLSAAECNAVVSALMECCRYCIGRSLTLDTDDVSFCDYIVSDIVSWLKFRFESCVPS